MLWEDFLIAYPYVKLDDIKNETIAYNDISSRYPHELRKKLPYKDYKFIENFDELKYGQDKDYGCFMLYEVKATDKIRNDHLYSQCPMLVSKCKITEKNLSEYQLNQIKEKRGNKDINYNSQSDKLISNLGYDSNCYLNFEMYQMMKKAGYNIVIKKILEFKHKAIFKNYIEYLCLKKKEYSLLGKKSMELCFKILMNLFYGSTLTDKKNLEILEFVQQKGNL